MTRRLPRPWCRDRLDAATRQRIEDVAARFRIPEGRLPDAGDLVGQAAEMLGRPLYLCYVDSARYSGSLLGTQSGMPVVVAVDRSYRGSGPVEILVVGHELGHALGLDGRTVPVEPLPVAADRVPDLSEDLLRSLLVLRNRCGSGTRAELACEYFGALLVSRSMSPPTSADHGGRSEFPGLESSMGGRRPRP